MSGKREGVLPAEGVSNQDVCAGIVEDNVRCELTKCGVEPLV